jgi:hypothetical protein
MKTVDNVGLVCPDHAPKAGKYAGLEPSFFLGKLVKLGFDAIHPITRGPSKEHMWVRLTGVVGNEITGTLQNTPILEVEYSFGDEVEFVASEVEDVYVESQTAN